MKEVLVYFEGPSDIAAMNQLFAPLIEEKSATGVAIQFFQTREGDKKKNLLTRTPHDAARIVSNKPEAIVAIVPDLYPPNKGFSHRSYAEMKLEAEAIFARECERISPGSSENLKTRFKVFCFKHDLEVLLLASPDELKGRLGGATLRVSWTTPVEDQNHDDPPKFVVKRLFSEHHAYYDEVTDAPVILAGRDYRQLAEACPQCFKPFVEFLENL